MTLTQAIQEIRDATAALPQENAALRAEAQKLRECIGQQEVIKLQIATLQENNNDHEKRLREQHDAMTRFNFLVSISTGGGLLAIITLVRELIK